MEHCSGVCMVSTREGAGKACPCACPCPYPSPLTHRAKVLGAGSQGLAVQSAQRSLSAHKMCFMKWDAVFHEMRWCVFIVTSKGISSNSTVISEHSSVNNNIHYVGASFNTQAQLLPSPRGGSVIEAEKAIRSHGSNNCGNNLSPSGEVIRQPYPAPCCVSVPPTPHVEDGTCSFPFYESKIRQ